MFVQGDQESDILIDENHDSPGGVDQLVLVDSRPATGSEPEIEAPVPAINPVLQQLLDQDQEERAAVGVEEIFDILPLYGTLKV